MFGFGNGKLKELLHNANSLIIDVRLPQEYEDGFYKGAINIPHTDIHNNIVKHTQDFDRQIIVYCAVGARAELAKKKLETMGYKNVFNAGGYSAIKNL